jgi:hypothetical protein
MRRPLALLPLFSTCLLTTLLAVGSVHAGPVFSDPFDGTDVQKSGTVAKFWSVLLPGDNSSSFATKSKGNLVLHAANWANTYVSLASPVTGDFGFFTHPVTFALDDITLAAGGIPATDARFKLSLAATSERAEKAANAISLRIRSGLLLFGYRLNGFAPDNSPENLSGLRANSLVAEPLSGTPSKLSLTLGPADTAGFIRFEIRAEGNGIAFTRSGTFPLTREQWGGTDAAALVIDSRRDHPTELSDTFTELTVGQLTVTR